MRRIAATLGISLALLLVASAASADVTRLSFQALDSRDVEVELQNGERFDGEVRVVSEEAVVLMTEDGEIRELRYSEIAKLRVPRTPADAPEPTEPPATPTTPRDEASDPGRADSERTPPADAPSLTGSRGYLPDDAVSGDAHARAAALAAAEAHANAQSDEIVLSVEDYQRYRSMISSARVKRIIGWSIASVGALILVATVAEKIDADRWGLSYDGRSRAAAGFILGGVGTPFIILGRSQHRRADAFAEAAAMRRPSASAAQLPVGASATAYGASTTRGTRAEDDGSADEPPSHNSAAASPSLSAPVAGDGPYDQPQAVRRTLAPAGTTATSADDDASADDVDATATSEDDAEDAASTIDAIDEDTANGDTPASSNDEG